MSQPHLPEPRTPDPRTAPPIRWGILGPGGIANAFADAVAVGTASSVVAVGSRSAERAARFAGRHGIATAHGSYEALVADPHVDAVYVASPHSEHAAHALLALEAGKPVLVEKAFTRSESEAIRVLDLARGSGLLVAEAMWSRYLPHYDVARQVVEQGLIGEVVIVTAEHSQRLHPDGPERLAAPELAGGALLDLGVYPVSFADHLLGEPSAITAIGSLTELSVDASEAITLQHPTGALAVLTASMQARGTNAAQVVGTQGRLQLDGTFYSPTTLRLVTDDGIAEWDGRLGDGLRGFSYEAAEFARSLVEGRAQTPSMPHDVTLRVMRTMDEVRRQLGVAYPGEG